LYASPPPALPSNPSLPYGLGRGGSSEAREKEDKL